MRRHRYLVWAGAAALVGSCLCALKHMEKTAHDAASRSQALFDVGVAALVYLRVHEVPPQSVADLAAVGYLQDYDDPRFLLSLVKGKTLLERKYVDKVRLTVPGRVNGYVLTDGLVAAQESREPLILIDMPGEAVARGEVLRINAILAGLWFKVVRGEPTGEAWFDEKGPGDSSIVPHE